MTNKQDHRIPSVKILVTGATGYVGGRLVPRLLEAGHTVHVLVRDANRVQGRPWSHGVTIHEGDLLDETSLEGLPAFDVAYYLVHAMGAGGDFESAETSAANAFVQKIRTKHCIYLGGLQPAGEAKAHLRSRAHTGKILSQLPITEFRAGPIIGSGSASFEMVRYLTERLPMMVTPKWVQRKVRPIAIRDVLSYLEAAAKAGPQGIIDIGSDVLTFAQMMQGYAEVRGLRRRVLVPTPVLAPGLAARWVQLVTPVSNKLAIPIIKGMSQDLVGDIGKVRRVFPDIHPVGYAEAVSLALGRIEADDVETRWSNAQGDEGFRLNDWENLKQETRSIHVDAPPAEVFRVVSSLGGETGWLAWQWAWRLRGALDRFVGGPGLRRGRRSRTSMVPGDAVDFWRVEAVEQDALIRLRAEMRLPGKAWLQFETVPHEGGTLLTQTALFEPRGVPGILYWMAVYPLHKPLFKAMVKAIGEAA